MGMSGTTPTSSSGTTPTFSSGTVPPTQGGVPNPLLQQMMSQALSGSAGQNPVEHQQLAQAEVLYQSQLEQLANMGFTNRQANLRGMYDCHVIVNVTQYTALVETGGDLNAAVNRLIQ